MVMVHLDYGNLKVLVHLDYGNGKSYRTGMLRFLNLFSTG